MQIQISNYHKANEVLYALDAVERTTVQYLSRLTLQKILYLSGSLAPLKEVILVYLRFNSEKMGPYKGDIQNTLDHLVGVGLVDIIEFKKTKLGALSNYKITDIGKEIVSDLIKYSHEEEKFWWISIVTGLLYSYLEADGLSGTVDEKIKSMIYQDPTYNTYNEKNLFRQLIDLSDKRGLTYQFSGFLKSYLHEGKVIPSDISERKQVEIMVVTFMEYIYTSFLNEANYESGKA